MAAAAAAATGALDTPLGWLFSRDRPSTLGRTVELPERAEAASRLDALAALGREGVVAAVCFKRPLGDVVSLGGDWGSEAKDAVLTLLLTELEKAEFELRVMEGVPEEDASSSNDCLGLSSKLVTARMVDSVRERPPPVEAWDGMEDGTGDGDERCVVVVPGTEGNGLSPRVAPLAFLPMVRSLGSGSGASATDSRGESSGAVGGRVWAGSCGMSANRTRRMKVVVAGRRRLDEEGQTKRGSQQRGLVRAGV